MAIMEKQTAKQVARRTAKCHFLITKIRVWNAEISGVIFMHRSV